MQENWWHPGVGETSCFLSSSGSSQLVYFHIPVSRSARIFELNKFKAHRNTRVKSEKMVTKFGESLNLVMFLVNILVKN